MKDRKSVTPDIFNMAIAALYEGTTLAQFFELHKDNTEFPTLSGLYQYAYADNARKAIYTHAREACADMLADQTLIEADNTLTDPARASNRIKARQWLASKIKPKVYGDRLDVDITGKIDVSSAILLARQRINRLPEPMIIDQEPDPFS